MSKPIGGTICTLGMLLVVVLLVLLVGALGERDRAVDAERLFEVMPAEAEAGRFDLGRASKLRARNVEKAIDDLTASGRITSRVTTTGRRVYRRATEQQDQAS